MSHYWISVTGEVAPRLGLVPGTLGLVPGYSGWFWKGRLGWLEGCVVPEGYVGVVSSQCQELKQDSLMPCCS